jgi:hypothetical protein
MLTGIEDLETAKWLALYCVTCAESEFLEVRDSDNETVTIGYFDRQRFHWTMDKDETEAVKSLTFVTKPPLWREPEEKEGS